MLIHKSKLIQETVELELPAFFKAVHNSTHYMLTHSETILEVNQSLDGLHIATWTKENSFYPSHLQDVLNAKAIAADRFFEVWDKAIQNLETEVLKSAI